MFVYILGTKYEIIRKKFGEDELFEKRSINGYCDRYEKQIVICDMTTYKGWDDEPQQTAVKCEKETLRHEILHAFLRESGMTDSSNPTDCGWSQNEEMIDWFAVQSPKIFKAYKEAGAL